MTEAKTSQSDPLRVDFLPAHTTKLRGRIGMTIAPGKNAPGVHGRWERDLGADLARLRHVYRTAALVSLLEPRERDRLGIADLHQRAEEHGLRVLSLAIPDGGVPPTLDEMRNLVVSILSAAADGENVVIHCRGGLGRSGLVAACCLVALAHAPGQAIALVRAAREGAFETLEQERCVARFAQDWRASAPNKPRRKAVRPSFDRVLGCLLAGAVGDALGYPVEFMGSAGDIIARYGAAPPARLAYSDRPQALVSDDTQMTLFTAEGVVRACQRSIDHGLCNVANIIQHALIRWYTTQESPAGLKVIGEPGWLVRERRLHARRAPGNTNMEALAAQARQWWMPEVGRPPNDSKGCGAIMRSAPIGLAVATRKETFTVARDAAVVTHGHPSGYLSSAYFAAVVHDLARGAPLHRAMRSADRLLAQEPRHEEVTAAIAAAHGVAQRGVPDARAIETLGGGWVAEEALSIALACAMTVEGSAPQSVSAALWRAAVHGGDSDSTASLTGNLLGAMYGTSCLPPAWLEELELRDVIERIANDLYASAVLGAELDIESYPPN